MASTENIDYLSGKETSLFRIYSTIMALKLYIISPEGTWKYNVKETDFLILTFNINPSLKLVCLRKDHDPVLFCHLPNTITFFFSLQ